MRPASSSSDRAVQGVLLLTTVALLAVRRHRTRAADAAEGGPRGTADIAAEVSA